MAEAAEQSEPTMEEILASIRKIIATETIPDPQPPPDDILELTDVVEEEPPPAPPPVTPVAEPPVPKPEPVVEVDVVVAPEPAPEPEPEPEPPAEEVPPEEPLLAPETTALAATSFAQLAEELEKQRISLAPHIAVGNGQQTLENLVVEIMKPLLKDWLDQNLAATVERLVQAEIERINRRHGS